MDIGNLSEREDGCSADSASEDQGKNVVIHCYSVRSGGNDSKVFAVNNRATYTFSLFLLYFIKEMMGDINQHLNYYTQEVIKVNN